MTTPLGIPPPPDVPRDQQAAWYWQQIQDDSCAIMDACDCGGDLSSCERVQDLISGAIDAGVVGHRIPVAGFSELQPLHSLLARYRRDLAREDEERTAFLAGAHGAAVQRRRDERRQSW